MSASDGALSAVNSALPLVGTAVGIVSRIFGGMALRSKQAKNENAALNGVVQGVDQALQQLAQAYNAGAITGNEAVQAVNSIWGWYWKSITPQIQPNRNGCASGGRCPGTALQNEKTNGVPQGFCASTEGASCCVGCGPIRLTLERMVATLQAGQGVVTVAPIGGDHYGLATRPSYQINIMQTATSSIDKATNDLINQSMTGLSLKALVPVETALGLDTTSMPGRTRVTPTFILVVIAAAGLYLGLRHK